MLNQNWQPGMNPTLVNIIPGNVDLEFDNINSQPISALGSHVPNTLSSANEEIANIT